jgi:hypothetical protein
MKGIALLAMILMLSGCSLVCPSMDENCPFMKWVNGE